MIEVLKQMVEALEVDAYVYNGEKSWAAIKAGKQAIAELESQEPVAWIWKDMRGQEIVSLFEPRLNSVPLYTHPPQRTWVDLTEEELRIAFGKLYPSDIGILELSENNRDYAVEAIGARHHWTAFKAGARAGEAKLKEKNT